MKERIGSTTMTTIVVCLLAIPQFTSYASAGKDGSRAGQAKAFGKTYGEWGAAWWQYLLGIPADIHPGLQPDGVVDCMINQSGPVWFIPSPCCEVTHFECAIPQRALFFPLIDRLVFAGGPFFPPDWTVEDKRKVVEDSMLEMCNVTATLDGVNANRTVPTALVQTPTFPYQSGVDGGGGLFWPPTWRC